MWSSNGLNPLLEASHPVVNSIGWLWVLECVSTPLVGDLGSGEWLLLLGYPIWLAGFCELSTGLLTPLEELLAGPAEGEDACAIS